MAFPDLSTQIISINYQNLMLNSDISFNKMVKSRAVCMQDLMKLILSSNKSSNRSIIHLKQ